MTCNTRTVVQKKKNKVDIGCWTSLDPHRALDSIWLSSYVSVLRVLNVRGPRVPVALFLTHTHTLASFFFFFFSFPSIQFELIKSQIRTIQIKISIYLSLSISLFALFRIFSMAAAAGSTSEALLPPPPPPPKVESGLAEGSDDHLHQQHQSQDPSPSFKKARRERVCTAKERISRMPPCAAGKRSSIYRGVTRFLTIFYYYPSSSSS